MADLPSGTVTFLFTDIEGSTALWEREPAAMQRAAARHDALIEQAVTEQGGVVVRPRGEGDSRFAVFARASDAVAAALALQWDLAAEPWPTSAPVRVRLALHTGEAELRDRDYYGTAVNRCARLRAVAHGGQALLSQATTELVQDTLPSGTSLQDLGEHRLRDLTRPERVFHLRQPGVAADFPPLRSLDMVPHNLPIQLTSFVGRERELTAIAGLLVSHRLLTLTGTGGCGKTRLALQVAADLVDAYPDGVWLAELAALADPDLVPQTVAAAVGVREQPGQPLLATLVAALRPKRLLLVLDNCEHLLDACARLAEALLRACPGVQVLATSRELLGVAGEVAWRVPSLAAPPLQPPPSPEQVARCEAVRLFVDRARLVQPAFALTDRNAAAVAQICRRLDGIPLALELAAARATAISAEQIAARLDGRFRLLTGGRRTALRRQQTLAATIDWSHDLLTEPEKALFRRLAVFAGGCTIEAAEAVGPDAGIPADDVLDLLARLVDKSLVQAEEDEASAGRYRLLETVRQYGQERLAAAGEASAVRDRHRDWCLALAERAAPRLRGAAQRAWLARLDAEHDNLRAALAWCERRDAELGLRLANALWWFWELRGHRSEGYRWLTALLARPGATRPTAARARALHAASHLIDPDRKAELAALCRASLALAEQVGDRPARARALRDLGWATYFGSGDARGEAMIEASLALFRAGEVDWEAAEALRDLAEVARARGDPARAEALLREALALCRSVGDARGASETLRDLGDTARARGDPARADALLTESLALARELGDREAVAHALLHLAFGARARGDLARAAPWLTEAVDHFRAVGNQFHGAWALHDLGWVEQARGETARAAALVGDGLALFHARGHLEGATVCLGTLGAIWLAQGRPAAAVARLLGAAAALGEGAGMDLEPISRADAARSQAAARRQLEAAAWEAAWAAGRALTPAEAVAYALAEDAERSA